MPEPTEYPDASYLAPVPGPINTGGPSTPNVSIYNHAAAPEHRHPTMFTYEDMVAYIQHRLGSDLWKLEGIHPGAVEDCINDALMLYGTRVPRFWYEVIPPGVQVYQPKAVGVIGVVRVDFISPITAAGGFGAAYEWNNNLTGVGVVQSIGPGLLMPAGDLMRWVMARKSFLRVASLAPQYQYDASSNVLHLYNPNLAYHSFCLMTLTKTFAEVNKNHKQWIRDHALALAKLQLAENREKFDGNIQAPGGGTIQMNSDKLVARATEAVEKSLQLLYSFQTRVIPIWGD